jgi:hypothetical protein
MLREVVNVSCDLTSPLSCIVCKLLNVDISITLLLYGNEDIITIIIIISS